MSSLDLKPVVAKNLRVDLEGKRVDLFNDGKRVDISKDGKSVNVYKNGKRLDLSNEGGSLDTTKSAVSSDDDELIEKSKLINFEQAQLIARLNNIKPVPSEGNGESKRSKKGKDKGKRKGKDRGTEKGTDKGNKDADKADKAGDKADKGIDKGADKVADKVADKADKITYKDTDKTDKVPNENGTEKIKEDTTESGTNEEIPENNTTKSSETTTNNTTNGTTVNGSKENDTPNDKIEKENTIDTLKANVSRSLKRKHMPNPITVDPQIIQPSIRSAPINSRTNLAMNSSFYKIPTRKDLTPKVSHFQTYLTPHKASPYKRFRGVGMPLTSVPLPPNGDSRYQYYRQFTPQPTANIYRYNEANYNHHEPLTPNQQGVPQQSNTSQPQLPHLNLVSPSQPPIQSINNGNQEKARDLRFKAYQTPKGEFEPAPIEEPKKLKNKVEKTKEKDIEDGLPALNQVVDVFHGEIVKNAPFQSQPLSAQKEFFDYKRRLEIDDDKVPATQEEMIEMARKFEQDKKRRKIPSPKPVTKLPPIQVPKLHYQPPTQAQPQPQAFVPKAQANGEVVGSIHFMNEYFYNFKMFNKDEEKEEEEETEEDKANNEKKKFLTICEKIWDEFAGNR